MPPEATTATRETDASASTNAAPESASTDTASSVSSAAGNSAFARALERGGYFIDLGPGITLSAEELSRTVSLESKPQVLPGVRLRELKYNRKNNTATVIGDITVPHLRSPRRGIRVTVNGEGRTSLDTTLTSDLPVFKNKTLQITLDEQHNLAATLAIEATDMTPRRGARNLTVTGGGTFRLANGKLSGDLEADLAYATLGSGHFSFQFNGEGRASGSGSFDFEGDFLKGASAQLEVDEGANLKADVGIPVSDIEPPIPGLTVTEGTVRFTMNNSTPGGGLENIKLNYNGLGEATINANIRNGSFTGNGRFAVTLAELTNVSGRLLFAQGILTGSMTIRSGDFPRALGVSSGQITATLLPSGDIDFTGEATINLGPAGTGQLSAAKENGLITIGTTIILENIPGLQSAEFSVVFTNEGKAEGEGEIAIDESLVPGLSGNVLVSFRDNLWAGETEIGYTRDDPSVNGNVTVVVRQTEEGTLVVSGSGELTAEIIPGIEGMAGVVLDEEGTVLLNFAITQTVPYELFPEKRQEREFLNVSQNIPLFAGIVVAVIRIRAGARAGVGPGQIRNSNIEGSWEISSEEPPDMTVSTEFFMPAFVEGYVAFGAGLGVDVVLGSLTGGIEAMATAGIYGAISVVPELSYENGDWLFDGTATMAAGARLKLSLNAWAEVEAAWITVWERSWELASHTMNVGPDLVLSANVSMNLSNPSTPELTFDASETDTAGLIDSALPKDGPPAAGTREAIENRAEWAGRSREPGPAADSVPPELANQANQTAAAPAAPARPAPRNGPPPGQNTDTDVNTSASPDGSATTGTTSVNQDSNALSQVAGSRQPSVPESQVVGTDQPRYPRPVTLDTLKQSPAAMPRTVAQEREDLNAAVQVFDLAEKQAQDSEQLATYFPRIRSRFQLTSIGYEAVGDQIQVSISINPKYVQHPTELLKGRAIAGKHSEINYTPGSLGNSSSIVGLEMVADPLGPDHPAGSGPRGQGDLMGRLQTDPNKPENQKYIRGHLLNDRIGGEGSGRNLFPITGAANRAHEQQIESRIKQWVNSDRYWVFYKVSVSVGDVDIADPSKKLTNKVNSRFVCEAAVYDLQKQKKNRISATIISTFNPPANADTIENTSGPDRDSEITVKTRREDETADIERSSREGIREYRLHAQIYRDLASVRRKQKSWAQINAVLSAISGLGEGRLDTLQNAYGLSGPRHPDIGDGLATSADKANLTVINGLSGEINAALSWL